MSDTLRADGDAHDNEIIAITPKPGPRPKLNTRNSKDVSKHPPYREKFFVSCKTNHPRIGRIEAEVWGVDRAESFNTFTRWLSEPIVISAEIE